MKTLDRFQLLSQSCKLAAGKSGVRCHGIVDIFLQKTSFSLAFFAAIA
jgi:hypothetical protein